MKIKKIVIIGAGDFGREVAWLIEGINEKSPVYQILGYLDDDERKIGQVLNGYKVLGTTGLLPEFEHAVIAMQDGAARRRIVDHFPGFDGWETLIHPSAHIAGTSTPGRGCVVCANSAVSVNTAIGDHCLFNISVTIGHDCTIGDYVSVMSGSCVCGRVTIGDGAYLATNSTVVPGMRLGPRARVGAGSVVLRNVKEDTTVMGVPAKRLRL